MSALAVNRIGLAREAYKGGPSTLCAGCGHNSITNHIIKALYEEQPFLMSGASRCVMARYL